MVVQSSMCSLDPSSKVSYEPLGPHRFARLPAPSFFPLLQRILLYGSPFCAFVCSDPFMHYFIVFPLELATARYALYEYIRIANILWKLSPIIFLMPQSSLPGQCSI
ncbi:hypothetical protein Zmor_020346 [Zophobas morio]|uniref:Uncharacterized protein n=1 Tax=Zophobas morio TaxID=2755281 RepID=A0AA38I5T0_9CUCU|nr:hypothetical protein Zmor_020346 [Zophobas morio]